MSAFPMSGQPWLRVVVTSAALAACALGVAGRAQQAPSAAEFAGNWKLVPTESTPSGQLVPKTPNRSGVPPMARPGSDVADGSGTGSSGYTGPPGIRGMNLGSPESPRTILRDLLEVPVRLSIRTGPADVTIVDDLERSLTFPTDDKKHKFLLSATEFEAKTHWKDGSLIQEITAADNVQVSAVYALSAERDRLYVSLKVEKPEVRVASGQKSGSGPANLSNRVYNRVK